MGKRRCPACGAPVGEGAQFCAQCGADLRAGMAGGSSFRVEEERGPAAPLRALLWMLEIFPGLFSPKCLICSLLTLIGAALVVGLAVFIIALGAVISGLFIAGFGMVMYWSAVSWILYGYVTLPSEAMAEFDGKKWTVFLLATFLPIAAFFWYLNARGGS